MQGAQNIIRMQYFPVVRKLKHESLTNLCLHKTLLVYSQGALKKAASSLNIPKDEYYLTDEPH